MRRAFLVGVAGLLGLSLWLAGCQNDSGQSTAGLAHVRVRLGSQTPGQQSAALLAAGTTQRVRGIPPEVTEIALLVTTSGQPIPGSPFRIPFEAGVVSVDIRPNLEHRFAIEARNRRSQPIFTGVDVMTLPPNTVADLALDLTAEVVSTPPQTQFVPAVLGGDLRISDPQSPVNGLQLRLFPAVQAQQLPLTITEVYNPPGVPILATQAGTMVDIRPSGTPLATPVTLVFPYDPTLVQVLGLAATDLRIWRFDPGGDHWQPVPNQYVDTAHQVIVAQLTSLSYYTVASSPLTAAPPGLPGGLVFQLDVSPADDPLYHLAP